MYVIIILAILDSVNVQSLHSKNLEEVIEAGLFAVVIWFFMCTFLIYYAQSQMRSWYKMEAFAQNPEQFKEMFNKYKKRFQEYQNDGKIKVKKIRT